MFLVSAAEKVKQAGNISRQKTKVLQGINNFVSNIPIHCAKKPQRA